MAELTCSCRLQDAAGRLARPCSCAACPRLDTALRHRGPKFLRLEMKHSSDTARSRLAAQITMFGLVQALVQKKAGRGDCAYSLSCVVSFHQDMKEIGRGVDMTTAPKKNSPYARSESEEFGPSMR